MNTPTHEDKAQAFCTITEEKAGDNTPFILSVGPQGVVIRGQTYAQSLLLDSTLGVLPWNCKTWSQLDEAAITDLLSHTQGIEVLLMGTGYAPPTVEQRLLSATQLKCFVEARLHPEVMDTRSACRTYNVLANEGRRVLAALVW